MTTSKRSIICARDTFRSYKSNLFTSKILRAAWRRFSTSRNHSRKHTTQTFVTPTFRSLGVRNSAASRDCIGHGNLRPTKSWLIANREKQPLIHSNVCCRVELSLNNSSENVLTGKTGRMAASLSRSMEPYPGTRTASDRRG